MCACLSPKRRERSHDLIICNTVAPEAVIYTCTDSILVCFVPPICNYKERILNVHLLTTIENTLCQFS